MSTVEAWDGYLSVDTDSFIAESIRAVLAGQLFVRVMSNNITDHTPSVETGLELVEVVSGVREKAVYLEIKFGHGQSELFRVDAKLFHRFKISADEIVIRSSGWKSDDTIVTFWNIFKLQRVPKIRRSTKT